MKKIAIAAVLAVFVYTGTVQANQQCKVSGKFCASVALPPDARFLVYVFPGKDAPKQLGQHIARIETLTDDLKTFEDFVVVPDGTSWLTFYYEVFKGPPVRIKEEHDNREFGPVISGLVALVLGSNQDSPTLRAKAAAIADKDISVAMQLFDEAERIGETPGQKVEAIRVKARTILEKGGDPEQALVVLEKAARVPGFEGLAESAKRGYLKEQLDYFEKTAFANGHARDTNGAFASSIIKDPDLAGRWHDFTWSFDAANLRGTDIQLAALPTISAQDYLIKQVLYAGKMQ